MCLHRRFKLMGMTSFVVTRQAWRVAPCIFRYDLSYDIKQYFPDTHRKCIFQRLLPNSKPVVIGIIAYLINQILGIFFMKTCLKLKRTFIVTSTLIWGQNGHCIFQKHTFFNKSLRFLCNVWSETFYFKSNSNNFQQLLCHCSYSGFFKRVRQQ